jgi:hypothetical protein
MASAEKVVDRTSQPTTLTSLPGDVRNHIYDLVLVHHGTNGVIAPLLRPDSLISRSNTMGPELAYKVDASRLTANTCTKCIATAQEVQPLQHTKISQNSWKHRCVGGLGECGFRQFEAMRHLGDTYPDFYVTIHENPLPFRCKLGPFHICTINCLAQPPLTRVNRQLRQEGLSYFYGTNKFLLSFFTCPSIFYPDMKQMHAASDQRFFAEHALPLAQAMTEWWRSIGETNFRMIRAFDVQIWRRGQTHLTTDLPFGWELKRQIQYRWLKNGSGDAQIVLRAYNDKNIHQHNSTKRLAFEGKKGYRTNGVIDPPADRVKRFHQRPRVMSVKELDNLVRAERYVHHSLRRQDVVEDQEAEEGLEIIGLSALTLTTDQ